MARTCAGGNSAPPLRLRAFARCLAADATLEDQTTKEWAAAESARKAAGPKAEARKAAKRK